MYLFAIHVYIFLSLFRSVDHLNIRLLFFFAIEFLDKFGEAFEKHLLQNKELL